MRSCGEEGREGWWVEGEKEYEYMWELIRVKKEREGEREEEKKGRKEGRKRKGISDNY